MRYWPVVLSLCLSVSAFARTIETQIHDIDVGKKNEPTLLLLESGDVVKVPTKTNKAVMSDLSEARFDHRIIKFEVDKDRFVKSWSKISSPRHPGKRIESGRQLDYEPTILNGQDEANSIFKKLNSRYRRRSECYNRAHIWSYESLSRFGLKSMKVFLFFTRKYIREYDFGWWFHVSPFTYVMENGEPQERVLDYMFVYSPSDMKKWTDYFMSNDATCTTVNRYSDYSNHQEKAYCYLIKTSMYYYQPLDLDKLESTGSEKQEWINWEVNNAYRQGFRR
jgi:hypothetical protein